MKIHFNRKTRIICLLIVLLLGADAFLMHMLSGLAKEHVREALDNRMLDIVNTAADMIDGDVAKDLTAGEEDTPGYKKIYETLCQFRDNIDLECIYLIRDMGNSAFIFLIDTGVEDPAAFGELAQVTDALKAASLGTPAVDRVPYRDRWGSFYSAYSPVRDSENRIIGVVAMDFDAAWYEAQIGEASDTLLPFGLASLATGVLVTLGLVALFRPAKKE